MSERAFFSFRFAIPGYILVLLLIAINYSALIRVLRETGAGEVFGAFLAFLSLFSGSALGFLVSQLWWWRFEDKGKSFGMKNGKSVEDLFITKYSHKEYGLGIPNCRSEKQKRLDLELIFDYIVLSSKNGEGAMSESAEEKLWRYAERKWDIYHVLSATLISLCLGLGLGFAFRIYYEFSIFGGSFMRLSTSMVNAALVESLGLVFVLASSVIVAIVIGIVRQRVDREYCETMKVVIRHCKPDLANLQSVFPDYFKPETTDSSKKKERSV